MSEIAVPPVAELEERQQMMQLLMTLEENGAIDAVGLDLTDVDLTPERWSILGRFFGNLSRRVNWYLGDWLNHGVDVFGEDVASQVGVEDTISERYDEAQQVTGLDRGTLLNISSICRKIPRARRRQELGFWIHAAVMGLDPEEQIEWLQRAIDENWTRSQLQDALKEAKNPSSPADDGDGDGGGDGGLTLSERIEEAARLVWRQCQPTSDGAYLVPAEIMSQLAAALGEE